MLAWAPVPLGSNRPWAWTILEVGVYALVALWLLAWGVGRVDAPEPLRRSWPAWILMGAWLALQALHVVPLPAAWVAALSPESARMHAMAAELGVTQGSITLSVDAEASRAALLKSLAYAGVFFLALALLDAPLARAAARAPVGASPQGSSRYMPSRCTWATSPRITSGRASRTATRRAAPTRTATTSRATWR